MVKLACVQMKCSEGREQNIQKAEKFVREAVQNGANIVLLPELFERPYFCQQRDYNFYAYAEETEKNLAVRRLMPLSKEFGVVIPVSFYEKDGNVLYNSVAVLDCGRLLGVYRKTHIPDDHYYQEKFYCLSSLCCARCLRFRKVLYTGQFHSAPDKALMCLSAQH